jgi:hypothetical protein
MLPPSMYTWTATWAHADELHNAHPQAGSVGNGQERGRCLAAGTMGPMSNMLELSVVL